MATDNTDNLDSTGDAGLRLIRRGFNQRQVKQLLQPINPKRVLRDGKGNAHVAQQDVTAHLNRLFGFGGWDKEILHEELVFEQERVVNGKPTGRWDVCYKARVRLSVKDESGWVFCSYEDGSMGVAENQKRGDAHDLAYKSAISLSLKRAAKDLGDQFGLSLYNKGQMTAIVKSTLVGLDSDERHDVQAEVEPVVAMGNDEIDREQPGADKARDELREFCLANGLSLNAVNDAYTQASPGVRLAEANEEDVRAFIALLQTGAVKVA